MTSRKEIVQATGCPVAFFILEIKNFPGDISNFGKDFRNTSHVKVL